MSGAQESPKPREGPERDRIRMGVARSNRRHSSAQPSRSRRDESPAQHLNNSNSLNFTIDSDFEQGRKVQNQIIELIERSGFNEGDVFAIKLALEEAMI